MVDKSECFCKGEKAFRNVCKECNDWLEIKTHERFERIIRELRFVDDKYALKVIKQELNKK